MSLVDGLPVKAISALFVGPGLRKEQPTYMVGELASQVAEAKEQQRRDKIVARYDRLERMKYPWALIDDAGGALAHFDTVEALAEYSEQARNQLRRAIRSLSDALIVLETLAATEAVASPSFCVSQAELAVEWTRIIAHMPSPMTAEEAESACAKLAQWGLDRARNRAADGCMADTSRDSGQSMPEGEQTK